MIEDNVSSQDNEEGLLTIEKKLYHENLDIDIDKVKSLLDDEDKIWTRKQRQTAYLSEEMIKKVS